MKRLKGFVGFWLVAAFATSLSGGVSGEPPEVDLNEIINESYQFLRNREPIMTRAEYSLYETIIPMVFEQPDYALRLLETMIADDEPESPAFEFVLGNMYFMQGRLVSSEARYLSALKAYPEFQRAWLNLGVLRFSAGRYAEAVPCFTRVIALGDREARTLGLLAYCLQETGNSLVAEMAYMQALTAEPDNQELIEGLLRLYLRNSNWPRAEILLKQLIRMNPEDGEKHLLYAKELDDEGRSLEAIIVLEVAAGIGVLNADGLLYLSNLQVKNGLHAEALAGYRRVLESQPDIGLSHLLSFARVLIEEGQFDEAESILGGLSDDVPAEMRGELLRARAELAQSRGHWVEAEDYLERLLNLNPLDSDALIRLGQSHRRSGDLARAQLVFERAYQIDESRYRACLELANLAVMNRKINRGVAYLEQAIELQPSPVLREHLERLKAASIYRGGGDLAVQ
ncbi:MAG: tetratricopeptide repeat protein [Opitutaceae bacterium]